MKVNDRVLMFFPNASYVVTNKGVQEIAVDLVSKSRVRANISKLQSRYNLIQMILKYGQANGQTRQYA